MWTFWRSNILVKTTCLVLATGLWMFVVASGQTVVEFKDPVAVQTLNLENGFSVTLLPQETRLKISAAPGLVKTLTAADFFAWVNLKGRSSGEFTIPLEIKAPEGVKILEKNPAQIKVIIERK